MINKTLGVGKTSLINVLCQNEVKKSTSWTIGCHLDVKVCFSSS